MSKLELGVHVISHGKRFRQLVEITKVGKKRHSETIHQEKINGKWYLRAPKIRKAPKVDSSTLNEILDDISKRKI